LIALTQKTSLSLEENDRWRGRRYTSGKLADHLIHASLVKVVTLEAFIRLANNGQLQRFTVPLRSRS
jgi:hypothetical protein